MLTSIDPKNLSVPFTLDSARLGDRPFVQRRLSDLRGCFADSAAFEARLAADDSVVYEVTAVEPAHGDGQLHYGLGILHPGKIGGEYFMTKGHYHSHRPAAEVYIGLSGEGVMLLEEEFTGESRMVPLHKNCAVYVPGHTAHRTMNTGSVPLLYLGIYPANAGHDYGTISQQNFRHMVIERNGIPHMENRNPVL
jgi:glucose-6-phosphate isomerase